MDRDPDPAAAERLKASIKEAIGKLTGNTRAGAPDGAEQTGGEAGNSAVEPGGEIKNATRTEGRASVRPSSAIARSP